MAQLPENLAHESMMKLLGRYKFGTNLVPNSGPYRTCESRLRRRKCTALSKLSHIHTHIHRATHKGRAAHECRKKNFIIHCCCAPTRTLIDLHVYMYCMSMFMYWYMYVNVYYIRYVLCSLYSLAIALGSTLSNHTYY